MLWLPAQWCGGCFRRSESFPVSGCQSSGYVGQVIILAPAAHNVGPRTEGFRPRGFLNLRIKHPLFIAHVQGLSDLGARFFVAYMQIFA